MSRPRVLAGPGVRTLALGALALGALLAGCPPWVSGPPGPPPSGSFTVAPTQTSTTVAVSQTSTSTAPTQSGTTGVPPTGAWAAQAERCIAKLEEVVRKVEAGDREAALDAHDRAYREEYENTEHDLEVASRTFLPEELFEGKMRNVVIAREDAFAQVKGAVKSGAPVAKVRSLVDELSAKIRADASKLDAQPPRR